MRLYDAWGKPDEAASWRKELSKRFRGTLGLATAVPANRGEAEAPAA